MRQAPLIILLTMAWVGFVDSSRTAESNQSVEAPVGTIGQPSNGCRVTRQGARVELHSPAFVYTLDTESNLRGRAWKNQLTGRKISLGLGAEVELDLDAAEKRIGITGWKEAGNQRTTHVFLPLEARDKKLTLTLGGFGLYDYRKIDVSINGHEVGVREALQRWHEPGAFDLGPDSKIHPYLRFGQDNIMVIHCQDAILQTERMKEMGVDINLPLKAQWPAQFEQYLTVGTPLSTPRLKVISVQDHTRSEHGNLQVELESADRDLRVKVTYQWNATEPVLHKFIEVQNQSPHERRLMNVRLGNYPTDVNVSDGEQGFPVYLADECFMSVAHPSGWAIGQDQHVLLRQYPGRKLAAGERFQCMEVVYGVAKHEAARQTFLDHVHSRSRRVLRGHDKPYAIWDTFGANEVNGQRVEDGDLNEQYILSMLDKFGEGQKEAGYQFDLVSTDFWVDYAGDLERFDPVRFPNGFTKIKAKLDELGIEAGLWIDSSWKPWTISRNPVVHGNFTHDPAYESGLYGMASLCRATDPIRTMYSTAFAYHIRTNGARLIKCDNLHAICHNPNHPHLPGVYSTEAIHDAVIQTLRDWDAVNPDVFFMLYWGYRSPWWLLHGDTIFESGFHMEAASPGPKPTPYGRDGVTVRLDQGQWWRNDVPPLGKDTLGVWLSDWGWNSHMGKDRWQEAFVMDLCRGSMLAQMWTDHDWLTPPERKQLAEFIALLKARPKCFGNPRFILGNPWKHEPYGYACPDGKEAFVVLNNCTWADVTLPLELNSKWGLADQGEWDIYRWYPQPAKLEQGKAFGRTAAISLRPFEVVLLEVVPKGGRTALPREFAVQPVPAHFADASRSLELAVDSGDSEKTPDKTNSWTILKPVTAVSAKGAILSRQPDHSVLVSGPNVMPEIYTITAHTDLEGITGIRLEVLPDSSLPQKGPGRAENGNFVLNEFRVSAAPGDDPTQASPVLLQNAIADFSQTTFGGWPVGAAIDGDLKTGWQVDPEEGRPHEAIFELKEAAGGKGGSKLTLTLDQNTPEAHTLGHFRLAVTTDKPPLALDIVSRKPEWRVKGQAPACPKGGLLVVSAELTQQGKPFMFKNAQSHFTGRGVLAGHEVPLEPVLRGPGYPASWQAWRIPLKASVTPQLFELQINVTAPADVKLTFTGHFIPAAEL